MNQHIGSALAKALTHAALDSLILFDSSEAWNPFAAVQNDVLGTNTLMQSASQHGVCTLVLLSTDKAVNPHSVMGVSKRVAGMVALSRSSPSF